MPSVDADHSGYGSSRIVTVPELPSTLISAPSGIRFAASKTPTAQGMPNSRLTMTE